MDIYQILTYILPFIASIVTWVAARKKRNNSFLSELSGSIDLLSDKYTKTLNELVEVKQQNANLLTSQNELKEQLHVLSKENAALRDTIEELNARLSGIKTISKKQ